MERPKTTIHILSALDGKITGPFWGCRGCGWVHKRSLRNPIYDVMHISQHDGERNRPLSR